jgi:hypothetical protein
MTKPAMLVLVCVMSHAAAANPTLAPYDSGTLTVSLPKGWNVTSDPDHGLIAAQQDPARKDSAAVLLLVQPKTTSTEELLLDLVASSISKDLKVAKREALPRGGHVMVADGTANGTKVRVGVLAIAGGGSAIVCLLAAVPGEFDKLGGLDLVNSMMASIKIPQAAATPPATTPNGKLVVPPLTRALALFELAGEWKHDDGITTTYVDRQTGSYAGFDAVRYTDKWTFDGKSGVTSEFFGITTAHGVSTKVVENKPGVATLGSDMVLTIKWKTGPQQEYLLRGIVELPTLTVITLNGPWYDKGVPADTIADPTKGTNLDQHWVRKRTAK